MYVGRKDDMINLGCYITTNNRWEFEICKAAMCCAYG